MVAPLGIQPSRGSQSLFLLQEADTTHEWSSQQISRILRCQPRSANPLITVPIPGAVTGQPHANWEKSLGVHVVQIVDRFEIAEIEALVEAFDQTHQIPRDIDSQLLGGSRAALGRDLDSAEKRRARERLIDECRSRLGH